MVDACEVVRGTTGLTGERSGGFSESRRDIGCFEGLSGASGGGGGGDGRSDCG